MSDGASNRGEVDPRQAAQAAAALGIRVYTIAMGSDTVARVPVAITRVGVRYALARTVVDEKLLADIATYHQRPLLPRAGHGGAAPHLRRHRPAGAHARARAPLPPHARLVPAVPAAGRGAARGEWLFRATRWGRVP